MSKTERALIAYAVLKDQLDKSDLYEGLMVFFRPITASLACRRFVPGDFANELAARYGLHVPPLVIESLAQRMAKSGLLAQVNAMENIALYNYAPSDSVSTQISLPKITEILGLFRSFAMEISSEIRLLDDEALNSALFDRLTRVESLRILSRRDGIEPLKRTAQTLTLRKGAEGVSEIQPEIELHLDYVVSRFILHLLEVDTPGFELISDIASASLAAETLLTYREPPRRGDAMDGLDLYLDAPICLDMLGVNPGREDYGTQLREQLQRAGCRVNVFLHSINEIERILDARKQSYHSGIKPFDHYHIDTPKTRDLVNILAGHSEQFLSDEFGFQVVDGAVSIPIHRRSSVGAEEEKSIRDCLSGWKNPEGKEDDVSTCCDLIRLRSALDIPTRILKAGPTLITRNAVLARTANEAWRRWLREKGRASQDRIGSAAPLALLDKQMAGLLWITQGGKVGTLGRAHLISNCAAAISVRKDVIARVYNTLIETSEHSAKIFSALINDQRAERALMDITFGDPDVVKDETVLPLLEKIRLSTAQEVENEKNILLDRVTAELAQVTFERDAAEARFNAADKEVRLAEQRERDRKGFLIISAFRAARRVHILTVALISALLAFLAHLIQASMSLDFSKEIQNPFWLSIAGVAIPATAAAVSGLLLTWDMPEFFVGALRDRVSNCAFRYFASRQGVGDLLRDYTWDFRSNRISNTSDKSRNET